jgi:RNA polymerase sigma factor (sigma-70 family)
MAATAVPLRSRRTTRRRPLLRVGDERLVARVRAGDDDAFEAIYDRYYLGLFAFCRHMLGSRDEAEDALQHSFASAYSALRGGDGVADLRPWLYTIARNRCLSALRAQRGEISADGLEPRPRTSDGVAGEIQLRADLRDLVDDLQRLPEDQRAALVLFELGDQTHEQIAAVLGVRREKVKALVFQAREALLRARRARDEPCAEVRERIATLVGDVPRRSILRTHIDRCPHCAAFEREVRQQRAAFSAILPVAPGVGLKASVLAFLGGGSAAALGGGTSTTVAGGVAAGGTTLGLASLGAKGVVTKVLAVVALAGGASEARVRADKAPPQRPPARHAPGAHSAGAGATATAVLHAPGKRPAFAVLRERTGRKHRVPRKHAKAPAPVKPAPVAAPAPAAAHPEPAPTQSPASAPAPVQQPAAAAPASGPAAPTTQQQPAPSAPAAPATTTSAPSTTSDSTQTVAPTTESTTTVAPSTPTTTTAPETTATTTSAAAPTDAATSTTTTPATGTTP